MIDIELRARLVASGSERALAGNDSLRLDGSDQVWLVSQGHVEIFAVPPDKTSFGSRRVHIGTLTAGEMVFGLGRRPRRLPLGDRAAAADDGRTTLLAVGQPGAAVVEIDLGDLKAIAREETLAAGLAALVEAWVAHLFADIERPQPPQSFELLQPQTELSLPADSVARTRSGVLWVRHIDGSSHFLGRPELVLRPQGFLLPISDETWLRSSEPTRLSPVETELALRGGGLWEGLLRFHRLFLSYIELLVAEAEQGERQRLDQKVELDRRTLETAYARLASVLGRRGDADVALADGDDLLIAACRKVGAAQGIEIRQPPDFASTADRHRLNRICAASRVRQRRVVLRDDWWRRDNGPLLAFRAAAEKQQPTQPVALLPFSPSRYELFDPADGRRTAVDAEVAESLDGRAYMFYPPLPERALTLLDLLRAVLRGRRAELSGVLLTGMAGGLLGLLTPVITGYLFGQIIPGAERAQLLQMAIALVLAAVAASAFQVTRSIAILRLGGKADGSLQPAIWDRLLALPVTFFKGFTVGDLADRAMGIDAIRQLVVGQATTSLLGAIFSSFSFALLFYYSWRLALVATGLVLVLALTTTTLSVLQVRHQRHLFELRGKIASLLFGLIHGIAKLRVAGAEPHAFALWAERFTEQRQHTLAARRIANLQATFNAAYGLLTSLGLFAMVGYSLRESLPISEFLAFNAAFGQFQAAALSIVGLIPSLLAMVPTYERLRPILEAAPEVDPSKTEVEDLRGDIELSHVSFRYQDDGPLILDDVSVRARPGEFVALVGPSGSGKSTCLRLILGFEQPQTGSIYFDGQDLPSLDMQSVRRQIGVVLQNGKPMVGDIFSNIVGSRNLRLDDAWRAARMAGIEEDIRAMPMGMHTIISEGAGTFSGGQVQRLLIARAIVHRPRILLFDEATSALDNRTQEIVSQSLERLKATRIVVAHRLSTIQNADRIFVIERGRVVESGNYQELIEQQGLFARLAERQIV